jgi:hypothetical protein
MREVLEQVDATMEGEGLLVTLAWLAGQGVQLDEDEVRGALRRAELLLATGGDPRRELELHGRAVTTVAQDLEDESARAELLHGLGTVRAEAEGLPSVAESLRLLAADPALAWQAYACALLADELAEE